MCGGLLNTNLRQFGLLKGGGLGSPYRACSPDCTLSIERAIPPTNLTMLAWARCAVRMSPGAMQKSVLPHDNTVLHVPLPAFSYTSTPCTTCHPEQNTVDSILDCNGETQIDGIQRES